MPIAVQIAIKEGWKAEENKRFGEVIEVRFVNTTDGKIMFRYAPKCEDEHIWQDVFTLLKDYDNKLKELRHIIARIDGRGYVACGCANDSDQNPE